MKKDLQFNIQEINNINRGNIYIQDNNIDLYGINNELRKNVLTIPVKGHVYMPYTASTVTIDDPNLIKDIKSALLLSSELVFIPVSEDFNYNSANELKQIINCIGTGGKFIQLLDDASGVISFNVLFTDKVKIKNIKRKARTKELLSDVEPIFPHLIYKNKEEEFIENQIEECYKITSSFLTEEHRNALLSSLSNFSTSSIERLYFMIDNSPLTNQNKRSLLSINSYSELRDTFLKFLIDGCKSIQLKAEIHKKVMGELDDRQREEILRTHIRQIKEELGEGDENDIDNLNDRANKKEWSKSVKDIFDKELKKLSRYNPASPDYSIQYTYLDTLLNLPWNHCDNVSFDLNHVEKILNEDHYGMEKVKDRIIEHMAVMKLRGDTKSPILCLFGPPGVGKTSLGKSVASALGRKYVRVALGGLHDESEIRGHRRTYLGAMPGRIITALEKCGTSDPVMVLDEIDKLGADYKGDPSQALLEVLDPEQNVNFHDNYLGIDYDLSKVLFIATANTLSSLSSPLLDRMEIIEMGGYNDKEKIEIAKRHIIPKSLEEHGFENSEIIISEQAIGKIIRDYTKESGVRQLEKKINELMRKLARIKVQGKDIPDRIDEDSLQSLLGKSELFANEVEPNMEPGIVTGLAWTQAGGDILFIESSIAPGDEGKLTLTGNLGDVMKESAILSLQYIKANHHKLGVNKEALKFGTVHVHVPEGAVPKDGPSAGITITTSLVSAFTGRKLKDYIAMTGEMTLRGKVLPVGGIREKVLAAKRAGVKTIILSQKNRRDIEEIKPEYLEGLEFYYVDCIEEVLDFALT